jgi:hypothetical protein
MAELRVVRSARLIDPAGSITALLDGPYYLVAFDSRDAHCERD